MRKMIAIFMGFCTLLALALAWVTFQGSDETYLDKLRVCALEVPYHGQIIWENIADDQQKFRTSKSDKVGKILVLFNDSSSRVGVQLALKQTMAKPIQKIYYGHENVSHYNPFLGRYGRGKFSDELEISDISLPQNRHLILVTMADMSPKEIFSQGCCEIETNDGMEIDRDPLVLSDFQTWFYSLIVFSLGVAATLTGAHIFTNARLGKQQYKKFLDQLMHRK